MKRIKQFRYYDEEDTKRNSPTGVSFTDFVSGEVFVPNYTPIIQLGIQSLPGTEFFLNESVDPVIIGSTGIYELDLGGETSISSLTFSERSMQAIRDNRNANLIVDIIYEKEEKEAEN